MNDLWDFCNSSTTATVPCKRAITKDKLEDAFKRIERFEIFVNSWVIKALNGRQRHVDLPFVKGWKLCLQSMKYLCHRLVATGAIPVLYTRKLNQDHVENLHSQLRGYHGFQDHPSSQEYITALRCLSCQFNTAELIETNHSVSANCESSAWEADLPRVPASIPQEQPSDIENCVPGEVVVELEDEDDNLIATIPLSKIESQTVGYIAGAACRKLLKQQQLACLECRELMLSSSAPVAIFSSHKNYKENALLNTSMLLRKLVQLIEEHFKAIFPTASRHTHPREFISTHFRKYTSPLSSFVCSEHNSKVIDNFLLYYYNTRIFFEIKLSNLNLKLKKKGNELNKDKKLNL